jgi:transposase-like protein
VASCRTCDLPARSQIDALLSAGSSVRSVARRFGVPRTSMGRHAQHVPPLDRKLGLIPPLPAQDPRLDPLQEALELLDQAVTERQRLKALEAVRSSTVLRLKELGNHPDEEALQLLDRNVTSAEEAFRDRGESFEGAIRALQGVREAIRQKISAIKADETIETSYSLSFEGPDGRVVPGPPGKAFKMPVAQFFADVPKRFHDLARFRVARTMYLGFPPDPGHQDLKVYEVGSNELVWAKDVPNA